MKTVKSFLLRGFRKGGALLVGSVLSARSRKATAPTGGFETCASRRKLTGLRGALLVSVRVLCLEIGNYRSAGLYGLARVVLAGDDGPHAGQTSARRQVICCLVTLTGNDRT